MRYLEQYRKASKHTDDGSVVDAAIHFMRENIERQITLQDILRYVGYSASHFSSIFKKQTGFSPIAYLNQIKIERACQMLSTTTLHINQICYKVGFEDSLYFSRLFSKLMGMSPRQYRESLTS